MKFAFNVPEVRILVEAADVSAAIEVIEDKIVGMQSIDYEGRADARPRSTGEWLIRTYRGEIEALPTCAVCGCTDDDACEEGCGWLAEDLCTTDDEAHQVARAHLGGDVQP